MSMKLVDTPRVAQSWRISHDFRMLEKNGRCEVRDFLEKWAKQERRDYDRVMVAIKYGCSEPSLPKSSDLIRWDEKNRNVAEFKARGGHARIMFFIHPHTDCIICTNVFWKTGDDRKKQEREFAKAAALRDEYLGGIES